MSNTAQGLSEDFDIFAGTKAGKASFLQGQETALNQDDVVDMETVESISGKTLNFKYIFCVHSVLRSKKIP